MPRNLPYLGALWFFAVGFSITSAGEPSTESEPNPADQTELMRLEKIWNESHLEGNAEALDRLWDRDLMVIVPKMKLINRDNALGMFRSSHMKFLRYETSDLAIRVYGDTAVVTGRVLRTRKMNDNEIQDHWHFSKVYVRRGPEWRVVLWQASEAPQT